MELNLDAYQNKPIGSTKCGRGWMGTHAQGCYRKSKGKKAANQSQPLAERKAARSAKLAALKSKLNINGKLGRELKNEQSGGAYFEARAARVNEQKALAKDQPKTMSSKLPPVKQQQETNPTVATAKAAIKKAKAVNQKLPSRLGGISLEELDRSEQKLKDSLRKVGRLAGKSEQQIESDWNRIKLNIALSNDLHIEEL